ncbi:MAG: S41 family peptidase [Alphaproteobacteria bacterium]
MGFENLADRHISPFQPGPAALTGLGRLSDIDGQLEFAWSERSVRLLLNGTAIAEHPTPAADDIYGWAEITATLLEDARRGSAVVAAEATEELHRVIFEGVLKGRDKYSRYLTPEIARNSRASRDGFGGIGITINNNEEMTVVRRVHDDTPAARAGIREGDRITHVDAAPIGGKPLSAVVRLLRGPVGDPVDLTLRREAVKAALTRTLIRDHIVPQTVRTRTRNGIIELELSSFNQGTARAVRKAIVRIARQTRGGVKGIVLDLRDNPGGLLDQAVAVSDIFIDHGRIISTRGRHSESNQIFDATPGRLLATTPMAVLINGRSASAAEIVAVALRDSGRAAIVGSSSYGKGTVQTIVRLPNNGELIITWARIYAPSGQTLHAQGIVPAICTNLSGKGGLPALLAALKAGSGPALSKTTLRSHAHDTHYSAAGNSACPTNSMSDKREMDAARLLLADPALHQAAIAHPPRAIAER